MKQEIRSADLPPTRPGDWTRALNEYTRGTFSKAVFEMEMGQFVGQVTVGDCAFVSPRAPNMRTALGLAARELFVAAGVELPFPRTLYKTQRLYALTHDQHMQTARYYLDYRRRSGLAARAGRATWRL